MDDWKKIATYIGGAALLIGALLGGRLSVRTEEISEATTATIIATHALLAGQVVETKRHTALLRAICRNTAYNDTIKAQCGDRD